MATDPNTLVHVGISPAYHNKAFKHGYNASAWGNSFTPTALPAYQLAAHIVSGNAWTPGYFDGNSRRNETFLYSEVIALDMDEGTSVADALAHPFIAAHAFLAHPTASSSPQLHKTRVAFLLDTPIESAEAWRALVAALIIELGLKIDPASSKPAQPYMGSTNRVEQPYINLSAVLPLGVLTPLLITKAWEEMEQALAPKPERIVVTGDRAVAYAEAAFANELQRLEAAPSGERNGTLYSVSRRLFSMALGEWVGIDESRVESALEGIVRSWEGGNLSHKSASTINSGRKNAKPNPLELPVSNLPARQPPINHLDPNSDQGTTPADLSTLWHYAPYMVCCPEIALIALHVRSLGIADDFTVADLAHSAGVSIDTAQKWLNKAITYHALAERSAELMQLEETTYCVKKAERHGAAVARRYSLTLHNAYAALPRRLRDHVQELMEKPDPDVVLRDEALAAGLPEVAAESLELVTEETSQSVDAYEVRAKAERSADHKAKELLALAEADTKVFTPDALPGSVTELRAALITALIATEPDKTWRHSELMWVAGVKRSSVAALIRKTDLVPAEHATFVDVPIEGNDLHRAVRGRCKEYQGAPVAWIDRRGEVIDNYSREVPAGAKAIRLNVGKKYLKRTATAEQEKPTLPPSMQPARTASPVMDADTAARTQQKARARQKVALRGCMEARGWKFMPGPFSLWEREGVTHENTWEGMVAALLQDVEWAQEQRLIRRYQEIEF